MAHEPGIVISSEWKEKFYSSCLFYFQLPSPITNPFLPTHQVKQHWLWWSDVTNQKTIYMFILHGQIGPATISFALIVGDKPQGPFFKIPL